MVLNKKLNILLNLIWAFSTIGWIYGTTVSYFYVTNNLNTKIIPITFTFLSSLVAIVFSSLKKLNLFKNRNTENKMKLNATVMLTVTMIIYWSLLAKERDWSNIQGDVGTIIVHLITPLLMIIYFVQSAIDNRTIEYHKKWFLWCLIIPAIFLTYQQILATQTSIYIYSFLSYDYHSLLIVLSFIISIALFIILTTLFVIWLNNKLYKWNLSRQIYFKA